MKGNEKRQRVTANENFWSANEKRNRNLGNRKKIRQHYNTRIRRSKESEKVTERRRRFNGAVGDNARNCVFLGSEANLQARSQDSTQDR